MLPTDVNAWKFRFGAGQYAPLLRVLNTLFWRLMERRVDDQAALVKAITALVVSGDRGFKNLWMTVRVIAATDGLVERHRAQSVVPAKTVPSPRSNVTIAAWPPARSIRCRRRGPNGQAQRSRVPDEPMDPFGSRAKTFFDTRPVERSFAVNLHTVGRSPAASEETLRRTQDPLYR